MKDGVYFDLPEKEYHALRRFSQTGIKDILNSPSAFWFNSNYNPLKVQKQTRAMLEGKVYHSIILEGEESFKNNFSLMPPEIEALNKNTTIFKLWTASQEKDIVEASFYQQVQNHLNYLREDEQILDSNVFKGGYSEVSILWTENGIEYKARIDKLKVGSIIDLKTLSTDSEIDAYINQYFFKWKIFIQLLIYRRAVLAARTLPVFGNKDQKDFIKQFKDLEDILLIVGFINRKLPQARLKVFTKENCSYLWRLGENMIAKAEGMYLENMAKYGEFKAWLEDVNLDLNFVDSDFPQSFYEILKGE